MQIVYLFILSLIFSTVAHAQLTPAAPQQSKGEPIELVHADSLLGARDDAEHVRDFMGNVSFVQGKIKVRSDRAIHYITENRAELIGNVVITQDDMVLKAPRADYSGVTGIADAPAGVTITDKNVKMSADKGFYSTVTYIADFYGHVKIDDDTVTITSDTLQYHRKTQFSYALGNVVVEEDSSIVFADKIENDRQTRASFAYGNVLVRGKYQNTAITADTIIHLPHDYYTHAYGKPILFQIDTVKISNADSLFSPSEKRDSVMVTYKYDTLTVACDTMTAHRLPGDEKYYFYRNVEILRGSVAAVAENSVYYYENEKIELSGKPVVWYDSTQLHADTIFIYIHEKKLNLIWALHDAFAGTMDDSATADRVNQLSGNEIKLMFERDSIRAIMGWGDAKSLYFLISEDSKEGAARNSADTVQMLFKLGDIEDIIWLGGVQGEFFPENIIENNLKEYFLPSYRWRIDKPQKKYLNDKKNRIYIGAAK